MMTALAYNQIYIQYNICFTQEYNYQTIIAADYSGRNGSDVTVLFNGQPYHAAPTALLYADDAMLKAFVSDKYSFSAANHPLPETTYSKINRLASSAFNTNSFAYSSSMMFGFAFLGASFVVFLIGERSRLVLIS